MLVPLIMLAVILVLIALAWRRPDPRHELALALVQMLDYGPHIGSAPQPHPKGRSSAEQPGSAAPGDHAKCA